MQIALCHLPLVIAYSGLLAIVYSKELLQSYQSSVIETQTVIEIISCLIKGSKLIVQYCDCLLHS